MPHTNIIIPMPETKNEWFIIVNPHAGSGKTMQEWALAEKKLCELDVPYIASFTGYKAHAKELSYKAGADGYRRIVAVGGDGSVHEIFTGILQYCKDSGTPTEEFYMAVIPIGSGNDWIKSLNVPHDTLKVVDLLHSGSFIQEDIVEVSSGGNVSCCMANIGGVGFDSHVCVNVNAKKERGRRNKRIYVNALIRTLLTLKRINVEVIGDGDVFYSGPLYSLSMGNGKYSGGGMLQTGVSELDDGLLDVLIVPVVSIFTIIKEVHRIFDGTTHNSPSLIYRRCRNLKVIPLDQKSEDAVEIDGEIEGRLPLEVNVPGNRINVLSGKF